MGQLPQPDQRLGHHQPRHRAVLPALACAVESALRVGRQRVGAKRLREHIVGASDDDAGVFTDEKGYCCAGEEREE